MRIGYRPENRISRFVPLRSTDAVDRRRLQRRRPVVRHRQPLAPRAPAVGAALEHDGAFAVPFRIDAEHRLAVFKQDGGGMAEVLARLAVDDHLAGGFAGEVDERNRVAPRRLRERGGGGEGREVNEPHDSIILAQRCQAWLNDRGRAGAGRAWR